MRRARADAYTLNIYYCTLCIDTVTASDVGTRGERRRGGAHAAGARKLARRPLNEDVFSAAASVAFSDSAAAAEIVLLAFLDVVFFVFFVFFVVGGVGADGAGVFSPPPKRSPPNAPNACNICQKNTGAMNALFKITRAPSVSNP